MANMGIKDVDKREEIEEEVRKKGEWEEGRRRRRRERGGGIIGREENEGRNGR